LFRLQANGTSLRTEVVAGITTWLTMVYIVVVNPGILADGGIDHGAAFTATCVAAALGTLAMGLLANYPIALAPGMGLNAYFAYVVVGQMHLPWQTALGAVFLSGVLFLLISLLRVREWLINAIPLSLKLAVAAGIGLFLGVLGLKGMGLVVADKETLVTLGDLTKPEVQLACLGFLAILGLSARRVPGAILIGMLLVAAIGVPLGLTQFHGVMAPPPSLAPTFLQMDIPGALALGVGGVIFSFFLVDVLDNTGTLIATTQAAGLATPEGKIPRLREALLADSGGAMLGAVLGTSTTTSYIESVTGIEAGGRTGLTAVVVALLFGLTLLFAPLAMSVPGFATAPALLFVACLMTASLKRIDWSELSEFGPAVVTLLAIPLTFNIATGIGLGFITYAAVKLMAGRWREISGAVWLIAAASLCRFAFF
jgi:AGZA family xanthine/uracil permease-like MFS transporter